MSARNFFHPCEPAISVAQSSKHFAPLYFVCLLENYFFNRDIIGSISAGESGMNVWFRPLGAGCNQK
jgi:hypothetical protein